MEVRDGWTTEMGRTKFDVTVDQTDYQEWLIEAGVDPASIYKIPLDIKFRVIQLLAASYSLTALVEYYEREGELNVAKTTQDSVDLKTEELAKFAAVLKANFGAPA